MNTSINGFYAVYITGAAQQGLALIVLRNGKVVGVDVGGVKYDGTYGDGDEGNGFKVRLKVLIPPNAILVQGVNSGPQGDASEIEFHLPVDFLSQPFIRVNAKHGPVNAKFIKLRELNE
ncbi:MAG: hypothetical protein WAN17_04620 [Candidatus Sulfotelmatobacter sp.]